MMTLSEFWKRITPVHTSVIGALFLASSVKACLVWSNILPFNSDEAVVALMARHILQGETPIFFYGQAYMGSLDAWLVALGFSIFGQQVWVIRFIQGVLYIGILLSTFKLGVMVFRSHWVGLGTIWLLAIPNVIVTLYTTASLGGYGEGLLLGNLILITGFQISQSLENNIPVDFWRWLLWGFLVGLGLWTFGLTLIYSLSMGVLLLIRVWKKEFKRSETGSLNRKLQPIYLGIIGFLMGGLPWWIFASHYGMKALLGELLGSAVAVETTPWLIRTSQHLVHLVFFGGTAVFGLRPSWEITWLAKPLMPLALAFWIGVIFFIPRRLTQGKQNRSELLVLTGVMTLLSVGFIFTSFGVDPSGRYFVPLVIPFCLFASEMVKTLADRYGRWSWGLILIIMLFNGCGIFQSAQRYPPGITTQFNKITQVDHSSIEELIQFLQEQDETRGYSNYWVAYPLAFLSQENIIFIPRLPYHQDFRYTSRDDRYHPYVGKVEEASKIAYITTLHPTLNEYLRLEFNKRNLTWEEKVIGDYHIFYRLSKVIRPNEIGLNSVEP